VVAVTPPLAAVVTRSAFPVVTAGAAVTVVSLVVSLCPTPAVTALGGSARFRTTAVALALGPGLTLGVVVPGAAAPQTL
jgi:hypothetical protein